MLSRIQENRNQARPNNETIFFLAILIFFLLICFGNIIYKRNWDRKRIQQKFRISTEISSLQIFFQFLIFVYPEFFGRNMLYLSCFCSYYFAKDPPDEANRIIANDFFVSFQVFCPLPKLSCYQSVRIVCSHIYLFTMHASKSILAKTLAGRRETKEKVIRKNSFAASVLFASSGGTFTYSKWYLLLGQSETEIFSSLNR